MNIYKHDMKINLKAFIFWAIGVAFLLTVGMTKFIGVSGGSGNDMAFIMDKIPRVVMVVFGMADVDILTAGGFYSVLETYVYICTIIYACLLGANAVARESIDKTYEFIFTKPCTRSYILYNKILAAFTYLMAFCVLNLIISYATFIILDIENTIAKEMILFAISNTLTGILFFTLSIFLASSANKSEKGINKSYKIFMLTYIASVVYDIFDWTWIIRPIVPLKYFKSVDLLAGRIDIWFVFISIALSIIFLTLAFRAFEKRDLNAV